jgi:hypothetical protein
MVDDGGYGPLRRRRGSDNALTHILMAVLGAGLAAGLLLAIGNQAQGGSLPGNGAVPAPAASGAPLSGSEQGIVAKVRPGLVLISTSLQYDSEAAAGTGMAGPARRPSSATTKPGISP